MGLKTQEKVFLDFHGREISKLFINGQEMDENAIDFKDHRIVFQDGLKEQAVNDVQF